MLKDLPHGLCQNPEEFADKSYLPEKYQTLVDGLWSLDRLQFERSLDYLTEPSLIPTFPEEILNVLCRASLTHKKSNDTVALLPVAYYQAVSPPIASSKIMEDYCQILCRFSVTEAFFFSRAQGNHNHRVLFEKLVHCVLSKSVGDERGQCALELVVLPLNDAEQGWFDDYLRYGKGSRMSGAEDTLTMRDIANGRIDRLSAYRKRQPGSKVDGIDWGTIADKLKHAQIQTSP